MSFILRVIYLKLRLLKFLPPVTVNETVRVRQRLGLIAANRRQVMTFASRITLCSGKLSSMHVYFFLHRFSNDLRNLRPSLFETRNAHVCLRSRCDENGRGISLHLNGSGEAGRGDISINSSDRIERDRERKLETLADASISDSRGEQGRRRRCFPIPEITPRLSSLPRDLLHPFLPSFFPPFISVPVSGSR